MSRDQPLIFYGRCRSGKRWFWCAMHWDFYHDDRSDLIEHGRVDTEDEAVRAARQAVERLADGKPYKANCSAGHATRMLKELNAAKRAAKPPSDDTGAGVVEYLYVLCIDWSDYDGTERRWVREVPIAKKTAKRIYYVLRDDELGFIDREAFDRDGRISIPNGRQWSFWPGYEFYATREAAEEDLYGDQRRQGDQPSLSALRQAMADAHPDRGGSSEDFIAARRRYVLAKVGAV